MQREAPRIQDPIVPSPELDSALLVTWTFYLPRLFFLMWRRPPEVTSSQPCVISKPSRGPYQKYSVSLTNPPPGMFRQGTKRSDVVICVQLKTRLLRGGAFESRFIMAAMWTYFIDCKREHSILWGIYAWNECK